MSRLIPFLPVTRDLADIGVVTGQAGVALGDTADERAAASRLVGLDAPD